MIEAISTKVLDILEADAGLLAGGNAYAAGWTTVARPDDDDDAAEGTVNLFDKPHDPDGKGHRPAVYVGTRAVEVNDALEFEAQSKDGHIEYRVLTLPLVICAMAAVKTDARKQRNQLRQNIRSVLAGSRVVDGYWYWLEMRGGSSPLDRISTTASGGNAQQVAEGVAVLALTIHYSWNALCDA